MAALQFSSNGVRGTSTSSVVVISGVVVDVAVVVVDVFVSSIVVLKVVS